MTVFLLTFAILYSDGSTGSFSTPFVDEASCASAAEAFKEYVSGLDQVLVNCVEVEVLAQPVAEAVE